MKHQPNILMLQYYLDNILQNWKILGWTYLLHEGYGLKNWVRATSTSNALGFFYTFPFSFSFRKQARWTEKSLSWRLPFLETERRAVADGALIAYVSSKSFMIQWNEKGEGVQNGKITGRYSVHDSFLKGKGLEHTSVERASMRQKWNQNFYHIEKWGVKSLPRFLGSQHGSCSKDVSQ